MQVVDIKLRLKPALQRYPLPVMRETVVREGKKCFKSSHTKKTYIYDTYIWKPSVRQLRRNVHPYTHMYLGHREWNASYLLGGFGLLQRIMYVLSPNFHPLSYWVFFLFLSFARMCFVHLTTCITQLNVYEEKRKTSDNKHTWVYLLESHCV